MKISKGWKIFLSIVVFLFVGIFLIKWIMIDRYSIPNGERFAVDMKKVRALAKADSGELPIHINSLLIAKEFIPEFAMIAGGGMEEVTLSLRTHQIVYANKTIIIDPAHDEALHRLNNYGGPYYKDAFDSMQQALKRSEKILFTHEHFDHIGGISKSPFFDEIKAKTLITKEQLSSFQIREAGFDDEMLKQFSGLDYQDYYSPIPGIVLIKSPGHTAGHQMIYLRLQNQMEYLFIGDIAWSRRNIDELTGRSKLVSMLNQEDAEAVAYQLKWLNKLSKSDSIHIVVSHDHDNHLNQIEKNLYANELE